MDQATISANTVNANGASVAIDINTTGDVSITAVDTPALNATTTGFGDAGEIRIASRNLTTQILRPIPCSRSLIHIRDRQSQRKVAIDTGTLDASTDNGGYLIDTGTGAEGNGNDVVTITAKTVTLNDMNISTRTFAPLTRKTLTRPVQEAISTFPQTRSTLMLLY